jgi:hypothetical protein
VRSDSEPAPPVTPADKSSPLFWAIWSVVAAFGTYFCMYGFRKPFTAATFAEISVLGLGFKTVLVASQVFGYMVSKFLGIKVIAEMPPERRAIGIIGLIAAAELGLLLFAVAVPWPSVSLERAGLVMVFGLVPGFLEGGNAPGVDGDKARLHIGRWRHEVAGAWLRLAFRA